jgi:hypothetical protein
MSRPPSLSAAREPPRVLAGATFLTLALLASGTSGQVERKTKAPVAPQELPAPPPPAALGARLDYARNPNVSHCPDSAELRDSVSARLGYPVFDRTPASRIVAVAIAKVAGGLRASVQVSSPTGAVLGSRQIDSPSEDCRELASALALAIAMALDPMRMLLPATPAAQADSTSAVATPQPVDVVPAPCPAAKPCAPCDRVADADSGGLAWDFAHVAIGPALTLGTAPDPAAALALEIGANFDVVAFTLSGLVDVASLGDGVTPSSELTTPRSRVTARRSLAMLGLCARAQSGADHAFAGCAVGGLGVLRGESSADGEDEAHDTTAAGSIGLRLEADLRLSGMLWARLQGDAAASVERTTLDVNGEDVWTTPPLWGAAAILAVLRFL